MQTSPESDPQLLDVFDLVDREPDAIRELDNFLQLRWSPNRSVGIRIDAKDVQDSSRAGKQVLKLDSAVRQDAGDAARSDPIGGHLGAGSVRPRGNIVVSYGRRKRGHMRLSFVSLNSGFTRSGERLVDILGHLVQRHQKVIRAQLLLINSTPRLLQSVKATVKGFPEGMPACTVIGAMLCMGGMDLSQSASGV